MKQTYDIENFGDITIRAKDDVVFTERYETVNVRAVYAFQDENSVKHIKEAEASATFTLYTLPERFTLIDLSNIVDMFGTREGDPGWDKAKWWDFDNNKVIDILDIVYVASRID